MTILPLLHGWTLQRDDTLVQLPVDLPHDAMLTEVRNADAPAGSHGAYFPGARYTYRKEWSLTADEAAGHVSLLFEGVYGHTRVAIDGEVVADWDSGYRDVEVPLEGISADRHEITVTVDNQDQPNSRWYTGSGIYRPVWIRILPPTAINRRALTATTRRVGTDAQVGVTMSTLGQTQAGDHVTLQLHSDDVLVAATAAPLLSGATHLDLTIPHPRLWSDETPHRYRAELTLFRGDTVLDTDTFPLGLRTVEVDAARGLRINGQRTLLRGACVHHDNGILGAATHRSAEYRRARLLKQAGYNAIRSAHNPLSRAFLDACDEIGLYVIDELTDVWFAPKTAHDPASRFDELWRDDATAMVEKDRLHPSVIMYSIGNENAETATPRGIIATRDIYHHIHTLDPDRPVTVGMNFMLNSVAARSKKSAGTELSTTTTTSEKKPPSLVTSTLINVLANRLGSLFQLLARLPAADRATRDALAEVDVAGYNYAWTRYRADGKNHPSRVILGNESFPGDLPRIWPLVEELPYVIGDFGWTGWDYLGETGLGTWEYSAGRRGSLLAKPFPHLVAGPGAIDITGMPGAPVALQQAVWGLRNEPTIMVRPVNHAGEKLQRTTWRASDAISSWSWRGYEGRTANIEVYSAAEEIKLLVNERAVGRRRAGRRAGYVAHFRLPYEPGSLTAIAYTEGAEVGRSSLHTAAVTRLRLRSEAIEVKADGSDLAFVWIELADEDGVVNTSAGDTVTVDITGPARFVAFGSADPAPLHGFTSPTRETYNGHALLVIRSTTAPGTISISATSMRHSTASAELIARPYPAAGAPSGKLPPAESAPL